ncbi:MAG: hypothetical protein LW709_03630 [Oxalobacteraceae bacterium]|jgi:hypothetical protein|nr:hypothetical protein [Oxalobacteraceae bacterium]
MSLSRTTSLTKIPEQVLSPQEEKQDSLSSDLKNKQNSDNGEADNSTQSSKNSTADQKKSNEKSAPMKKLNPPVVRQKLTQRERSNSSPVIHRPLPPSPPPPSSRNPDSAQPEISSSPKLKYKKSEASSRTLTADQQLASDLADLIEKVLLRKPGRIDDQIDLSQATVNLQKKFDKKADGKVVIENMTIQMYGDDLKKLEAWKIAQDIIIKIRINYFKGQDFSNELDPVIQKEVTGMLSLLAASFAGVFFNISGKDSTIRLPESLMFFLKEIDYRQIRILLSDDKGIAMSQDNFLRLRRDWMAKVLIDTFLVPLVQKEFFSARGALATDHVVSQIISALHSAFAISAPAMLSDSLKSAPADIQNLVKKRRTTQFKLRIDIPDKSAKNDQTAQKKSISTYRPTLVENTSPSRHRRSELSKLLKKLIRDLKKENAEFTPAMLSKIKSFNNDFALSKKPISEVFLYQTWLDIASNDDGNSAVLEPLKSIVVETAEIEKDQSFLDSQLLEIDLFSKLTEIEKSGKPLSSERARRLSSDMPLNPISTSNPTAAPIPTPQATPIKGSSTQSTPSSTSSTSLPKSPRPQQIYQHRRVRTTDVSPVKFSEETKRLTEQERGALLNIYPDLLLGSIQRAAYKKTETGLVLKNDPIREIIASGRYKLQIPLDTLTKVLREKIQVLNSLSDEATTISHADLLKTLMLEEFKASTSGKILLSSRQKALGSAGPSGKPNPLDDQQKQKAEKNRLLTLFKNPVEEITTSLFHEDISTSGFPQSLMTLWKSFDQKLVEWARATLQVSAEDLEKLRSTLGFDLIVTRLIYPMCIGIGNVEPTLAATSFADAVRKSTLQTWDTFFQAFKKA